MLNSLMLEDGRDEVAELRRGERVALEIGGELALPVDDYRIQGMNQGAFVLPEFHAEIPGDSSDVGRRPGEEMPDIRLIRPDARVIEQRLPLIVFRVQHDGHEDEIAAQPIFERLLKLSQVAGEAKAIRGVRAPHVPECQGDNLSRQT